MDKKVKVVNLISSRVSINVPDIRLHRVWEQKGAVKTIPFEQLEEAMYDPGVEALFKDGVLGLEDMDTKKALELEPQDAKEPVNIVTLNDQQRKRYLTIMPLSEFKQEVKKLPYEQVNELAQYAIQNNITNMDKAQVLKEIVNVDIIKAIELNKADKEAISATEKEN